MAKRHSNELRQWAVIGAEQRLLAIAEEAAMIFRVFPELRARGFMARGTASDSSASEGQQRPARRRRRKMSADARRRISEAQKARWAKVHASKKK
jgi:hypothetical protein